MTDQRDYVTRPSLDDSDIDAVLEVLRSDWLTTGPRVAEFEEAFGQYVVISEAVAVSSGTAALHATMHALDIGPGDEAIVPSILPSPSRLLPTPLYTRGPSQSLPM